MNSGKTPSMTDPIRTAPEQKRPHFAFAESSPLSILSYTKTKRYIHPLSFSFPSPGPIHSAFPLRNGRAAAKPVRASRERLPHRRCPKKSRRFADN
jgi:hypothetical protein